jgi:hypothetical protein
LRDWEVVKRLNDVVGNVAAIRKTCALLVDRASVKAEVEAAVAVVTYDIPKLDLGFKVPVVEVLAVLWPGQEIPATEAGEDGEEGEAIDGLTE